MIFIVDFHLYHSGGDDPEANPNSAAIDDYMCTALALALAKRAQKNNGQSDPVQLRNNVRDLITFFTNLVKSAVQGYFNYITVLFISLIESAQCSDGNLIDRSLQIGRATTDAVAKDYLNTIGHTIKGSLIL